MRNDLVPVVRRVVGDRQRQSGNAGVVDEHIEPAQRSDRLWHHALDFGAARHIAAPGDEAGDFLCDGGKRLVVDVTDENLGAVRRKGTRKLAADAGRAGRYQYTLRHESHGNLTTASS